ncbi:zinc finger, CCHC-type containing protein [Tanacetum coccineum]
MGDENPIRTLGDYSKPSHEGYRNTIELPVGNNVVPLRSDTIRLVQNGCSFHGLRSEDPNQHLKDFLKLVDSLDLDGSITTWEDLTTRFLAQFFPPGRTAKLRNDILMFQQHHGESLSEAWTRFKDLLQKSLIMASILNALWKQFDAMIELPKCVCNASESFKKHNQFMKLMQVLMGLDDSYMQIRSSILSKEVLLDVRSAYATISTILKKKITKKEDIGGNFEIPCSLGGLKHVNALVDEGFDVNVMPYSTYMKLTNEIPAKTDIRLSLVSHSYIYPLGIDEDVLVEVVEHVYPKDFVILDIKEDEKRPFILGTPFLTMAKAVIKFNKGTITLRSGKSKISFHMIPESPSIIEKGVKNDIEPIAPLMIVNRLVLEWEERIRLHQEKDIEFNRWRCKNFKDEHPALIKVKGGMDDEGEVKLSLMRRSLEVLRKFHWTILGGRFNQLSHVSSPLLSKPREY